MSTVSNLAPYSPSSFFNCSEMDLPRERGGGVDWNTLGNILTAQCLAEVFHASHVDPKHRLGTRPVTDCTVESGWRYAYEEYGIVALKKTLPDSPLHCFMGRGHVDLPLGRVASFVGCIESTCLWDRNVTMIKVIETLHESQSCSDTIVYMRIEAKRCLVKAKCDFVYFLRCAHKDGKYIRTAVSVEHPSYPPLTGITRGTLYPGSGWVLEPSFTNSSKTLVSYLAHADIHGIPPIVINRVIRRHPLFVHYMRSHLMQSESCCHFTVSNDGGWTLVDSLEESSPLYLNRSESIDTPREEAAVGDRRGNWHERHAAQMTRVRRRSSLLSTSPCKEDCSVLEFGALQLHPDLEHWRKGDGASGKDTIDSSNGCKKDVSECEEEGLPTIIEESVGDSSVLVIPRLEEDSGNFSQGHGSASDIGSFPCSLAASTTRNSVIVCGKNDGGVVRLDDFVSER